MTNTNNTSNNGAISVIDTNNQAAARNNQTAGLAVKTRVKIERIPQIDSPAACWRP
jgi:hypothetical protein